MPTRHHAAATRRQGDRILSPRDEHQPIPRRREPPPMEKAESKAAIDEFRERMGWKRSPAIETRYAEILSTPTTAQDEAEHERRKAVLREQARQIQTQEVSKACDTGEHEKCALCGCGCHRGAA